jgi:hypothetical protein
MLMAFADVNTDVRKENTDVRWVGFLPPLTFSGDLGPFSQHLIFFLTVKFTQETRAGNTKGGSITVLLTSCLTGLESAV